MSAEDIVSSLVTLKTNGILAALVPSSFDHQELLCQVVTWTDQLEAGSTVKIARLPPGAMIHYFDIWHGAYGAAVTAMLGDSDDADRYVLTGGVTDMTSAGHQRVHVRQGDYALTSGGVLTPGTVGVGYIQPAWTDILMTTETEDMTGEVRTDVITWFSLAGHAS